MSINEITHRVTLYIHGLNENDIKLLACAFNQPKSIAELSKQMNVAAKNIIARLPKLEEQKLIRVNRLGQGKKTLVETDKSNPRTEEIVKDWAQVEATNQILNSNDPKDLDLKNKILESIRLSSNDENRR